MENEKVKINWIEKQLWPSNEISKQKLQRKSPVLTPKPLLFLYKPWVECYCNSQYRAYFNILLCLHIFQGWENWALSQYCQGLSILKIVYKNQTDWNWMQNSRREQIPTKFYQCLMKIKIYSLERRLCSPPPSHKWMFYFYLYLLPNSVSSEGNNKLFFKFHFCPWGNLRNLLMDRKCWLIVIWLRSTSLYNRFPWVQIKIFKSQKKWFLTLYLPEIEYLEQFRGEIILAVFYLGERLW